LARHQYAKRCDLIATAIGWTTDFYTPNTELRITH